MRYAIVLAAFAAGLAASLPMDKLLVDRSDVWLPNLRGIPLGAPGTTAAEFVVGSTDLEANRRVDTVNGDDRRNDVRLRPQKNTDRVRSATPCSDPSAAAFLFEEDGFEGGRLSLSESAPRMGLYGFPTGSVQVEGSCCWELFDRAGFTGRMLRLCPGK